MTAPARILPMLLALKPEERAEVFARLPPAVAAAARYAWREVWARPDQLAPGTIGAAPAIRGRPGLADMLRNHALIEAEHSADWSTWLVLGARGAGKGRTGSQTTIERAKLGPQPPIALVGATMADVRDVMVCETPQPGQSGIIAVSEPGFRPQWIPSKRALRWPNGVTAYGYSADEPERLRGPQHGFAWADDVAAWGDTTRTMAWDMLQFGMRLGARPQVVCTTTPKPIPWLVGGRGGRPPLGLLNDPSVMISRSRTADNRHNLAATFLQNVVAKYAGTRLGRQELEAEILGDVEGALWTMALIESLRLAALPDGVELKRIVVAIDPQASDGTGDSDHPEGPETGIVVAGVGDCPCKGEDKIEEHGFILEDLSGNWSPDVWATKSVRAYERHRADRIVAEKNNGGAMVENTLRTVSRSVSLETVWASRGKRPRAEPVAALYEQCVAEGTPIATARGWIPIELVRAGDFAWTRAGLRRVQWAGCTGERDAIEIVSDGHTLVCTPDHPVLKSTGSFQSAVDIVCKTDRLITWISPAQIAEVRLPSRGVAAGLVVLESGGSRALSSGRLLSLEAFGTTSSRIATGVRALFTAEGYYIGRSGRPAMAQSPTVGTSTTRIATLATTLSTTLKRFRRSTTQQSTPIGRSAPTSQSSGCEMNGTGGGPSVNQFLAFATTATETSSLLPPAFASAPRPATRSTGIKSRRNVGPRRVYNLSVEGEPEFFASGILVHNCKVHHVGSGGALATLDDQLSTWAGGLPSPNRLDALVWAVSSLMIGSEETSSDYIMRMG